jgi:phytoene synthase
MADFDPSPYAPPIRLALAYATAHSRPVLDAVFSLDGRLGRVASTASEPMIGQLKLAWWRDQLGADPAHRAKGEPLLAELVRLGVPLGELAPLVDGWEALLVSDAVDFALVEAFAQGRASAFAAVAVAVGETVAKEAASMVGTTSALAELASRLPEGHSNPALIERLASIPQEPPRLPRSLRPLAVLDALARRALTRKLPLLDSPAALALAMRVGIFGR